MDGRDSSGHSQSLSKINTPYFRYTLSNLGKTEKEVEHQTGNRTNRGGKISGGPGKVRNRGGGSLASSSIRQTPSQQEESELLMAANTEEQCPFRRF